MSHLVTLKSEVKNETAVRNACKRLKLPEPVRGSAHLYSTDVSGLCVQLPNWSFPVVINTDTGALNFDNYNEHWGKTTELNKFQQAYAIEAGICQASAQGHAYSERALSDGTIELEIIEGW